MITILKGTQSHVKIVLDTAVAHKLPKLVENK